MLSVLLERRSCTKVSLRRWLPPASSSRFSSNCLNFRSWSRCFSNDVFDPYTSRITSDEKFLLMPRFLKSTDPNKFKLSRLPLKLLLRDAADECGLSPLDFLKTPRSWAAAWYLAPLILDRGKVRMLSSDPGLDLRPFASADSCNYGWSVLVGTLCYIT